MMQVGGTGAEGLDAVVSLLTAAFVDCPVTRYLFPDITQYFTHFPDYVRLFAAPGLGHGGVHLAGSTGAAVWVPPGAHADPAALGALMARCVVPGRRAELLAVYAAFDRAAPDAPCWYLPFVGVDPLHLGKGIGRALMEYGVAMCDRDGTPAYLEATRASTVPYYERLGFVVRDTIAVGGHPPVTTMLRPPRR
jgi:GNAT superfamily N-acetyltransferase